MKPTVTLGYSEYPKTITGGTIQISENQFIRLFTSEDDPSSISIEVVDDSFGGEYFNKFTLDYNTAQDLYAIIYQMLRQISGK